MQQLLFDMAYMDKAAREWLIKRFNNNAGQLLYEYRKTFIYMNGKKDYQRDLPLLRQLMAEGLVRLVKVDRVEKIYEFHKDGFNS